MHLWPSFRLRDSFKWDYLKNLDRNLQRMKSDRQRRQRLNTSASSSSPSPHPKPDNSSSFLLLPSDIGDDTPQVQSDADKADGPPIPTTNWILILLSELFLILSCCYYY
ncbi:hypothetical protein EJ110_NYTH32865 [Nymphaea thermarum]|nr:hypothetical protein EJ110_NYTH32865 [Nymphaea thermarum]